MAVVVITGASSGIGEAAAQELARRGHRLVLAARRVERLQTLAQTLSAQTDVLVVACDVAAPGAVADLARQSLSRFGRIDVWINNAGVGMEPKAPWWEQDPAIAAQMIDINLTAPIEAARAVIPQMKAQGGGHIINVASVAGHIATHGLYSATKFGLRGHSDSLRREVARYGIHVSLVSPGYIRTEMTAGVPMAMPGPDVVARAIARLIERPRREVVVPGWYRLLIWFTSLAPRLTDRAFRRFMRQK